MSKSGLSLALMIVLLCAGHASAQERAASAAAPGVVQKVEDAVVRGAKAAASGIERGAKAAASGIERGTRAAASGVQRGVKAAASGVQRGAEATARAASTAARKASEVVSR